MFILRRITSELIEINTNLGIEYVFVSKSRNKEEFNERTKEWDSDALNDIVGIVCFNDGESIMPLYKKSSYYIMTGDGNTFDNLSSKLK